MNVGLINYENEPQHVEYLYQLRALFQKFGINFDQSSIDIMLMRSEVVQTDFGQKCLSSGIPIILLVRMDSAVLDTRTRAVIEHENIVAVFQNRILRQPALYNYPIAEYRFHGKLINDYTKTATTSLPEPRLKIETLRKIKHVIWDIHSAYVNSNYENEKKIWNAYPQFLEAAKNCDVDVMLFGTLSGFDVDLINLHRARSAEQVKALRKCGLRVVVGQGLSFPAYADLMRRSKVAVSPWGYGEWCFRDVEAFYFGAALVKPNTDFVLTYPDLFRDDLYYRYVPDASDLSSAVFAALEEFESKTRQRFEIRRQMIETMNMEWIVAKMANAIFDAYASR